MKETCKRDKEQAESPECAPRLSYLAFSLVKLVRPIPEGRLQRIHSNRPRIPSTPATGLSLAARTEAKIRLLLMNSLLVRRRRRGTRAHSQQQGLANSLNLYPSRISPHHPSQPVPFSVSFAHTLSLVALPADPERKAARDYLFLGHVVVQYRPRYKCDVP